MWNLQLSSPAGPRETDLRPLTQVRCCGFSSPSDRLSREGDNRNKDGGKCKEINKHSDNEQTMLSSISTKVNSNNSHSITKSEFRGLLFNPYFKKNNTHLSIICTLRIYFKKYKPLAIPSAVSHWLWLIYLSASSPNNNNKLFRNR